VEGGADTLGAFFDQNFVNQVMFFYAPKMIGGAQAVPAVGGLGVGRMDKAKPFREVSFRRIRDDLLVEAFL
ncbi:MAG: dihydrofolate reductase family protein, partial [Verrucomicrobiae bacterium]|nr:dihydrofolate reductase family protein [Verrucomicrobiae bacterium]